jgi:hypothetical protein
MGLYSLCKKHKYIQVCLSESVEEVGELRNISWESLSEPNLLGEDTSTARGVERVSVELIPVIKDALREGSAASCHSQSLGETERLGDG